MIGLQFAALLLTAIALVPGGAHAASLMTKMAMTQPDYFIAQMTYNGWALFGIAQIAALGVNVALAIALRHETRPFRLSIATVAWSQASRSSSPSPIRPTSRRRTGRWRPPTGRRCAGNGKSRTLSMRR